MSGSGRKDFDVKHILRLRWKLFSHPSPSSSAQVGGGCLQPDGSGGFEHWGPSQSRLLKSQEKGSVVSTFWKKSSSSSSSSSSSTPSSSSSSFNPLNGTLLPMATRLQGAPGQGTHQPARTLFYVESIEEEEVPGMDFPGPHEKGLVLQELKVEQASSSQATGEGCGHSQSVSMWDIKLTSSSIQLSRELLGLRFSRDNNSGLHVTFFVHIIFNSQLNSVTPTSDMSPTSFHISPTLVSSSNSRMLLFSSTSEIGVKQWDKKVDLYSKRSDYLQEMRPMIEQIENAQQQYSLKANCMNNNIKSNGFILRIERQILSDHVLSKTQ
ncbi:kelch-like protein 1, partial [Erinaceus europaeus]|uniref:Kelch-like protein 1 n=1 Tax=Erinaceus europaeus TaxID=9365 RepID=A0ABM3WV71_ERIEU